MKVYFIRYMRYGSTNYQELSVGRGCGSYGKVLHEMLHAMGFIHTHNRPDRDNYIKVPIIDCHIFFYYLISRKVIFSNFRRFSGRSKRLRLDV